MTTKEFSIKTGISDAELAKYVNAGWQIQYMQFMSDTKLHVVFVREVTTPEPAPAPVVTVVNVPVKPIESVKLPAHMCIVGLGEPPRSVPLTHNKAKTPAPDPVMEEALRRGKDTFNRVRDEGEAKIRNARPSFIRNQ